MKILCGTDIIEIDRIKKSIERSGKTFLKLIYTPNEIEYCDVSLIFSDIDKDFCFE